MGVTLERVQNKFACIIGELCSEPVVLSQFAIWLDLRLAEYKAKGAISLECSGEYPDPTWLNGHKIPPQRAPRREVMPARSSGSQHTCTSCKCTLPILADSGRNADLSSLESNTFIIKEEALDESRVFPVGFHTNETTKTAAKRTTSEAYLYENTAGIPRFSQGPVCSGSPRKVRKLDSSPKNVPGVVNESLLSIIAGDLQEQDNLSENSSDTIEMDFSTGMHDKDKSRSVVSVVPDEKVTHHCSPTKRRPGRKFDSDSTITDLVELCEEGTSNKDDQSIMIDNTTIILPDVLEDDPDPENLAQEPPERETIASCNHGNRESSPEPLAELGSQKMPSRHPFLESADPSTSDKESMLSSCRIGTCNCRVEISNRHLHDIQTQFRKRADPTGFYLKLMDVAFTKDELASSNLSGLPRKFKGVLMTKKKLCEKRIRAIGICTQRVFPTKWPLIKDTVKFKDHVNAKCRAHNRRKSLNNLAHNSG